MSNINLSQTEENYLKSIFHLSELGSKRLQQILYQRY